MKRFLSFLLLLLASFTVLGQTGKKTYPLTNADGLTAVGVSIAPATYLGKKSVRIMDTAKGITSELKYAKLADVAFRNGTIELELSGAPLSTAGESARGFVGVAFRIDNLTSKFECLYLRPTNGRATDQVRRNHSVQYISYPDYPWQKLRATFPEKYESYADMEAGKWIRVKIEVQDSSARLFLHGAEQPCLIVSDLKHGAEMSGAIGLWLGSGTEAHFRNLVITPTGK